MKRSGTTISRVSPIVHCTVFGIIDKTNCRIHSFQPFVELLNWSRMSRSYTTRPPGMMYNLSEL